METSVENVVKHPIWRAREPLQAWTTNTEDQWTTAQDLLKHLWATTQLNPFWQAGPYKSSERALFNGVGSTAVGGTDLIWQLLSADHIFYLKLVSVEQFSDAWVLFASNCDFEINNFLKNQTWHINRKVLILNYNMGQHVKKGSFFPFKQCLWTHPRKVVFKTELFSALVDKFPLKEKMTTMARMRK